jgi:hypothetical protein
MNTVRQAAAWTYRILITLFAAAVIVEVFLAGLGAFHAVTAVLVLGLALFLTVRAWAREPADPSRTASAHCASTGARCLHAGPDTGTLRAGPVRRLRP